MTFKTIEQLIRIGLYTLGAYLLGSGVADGEMFQAAIGGAVNVAAFAWWLIFERGRIASPSP